ncbi:MAG: hydrolase [Firmicutes bacterium]|nr:hydrolase [Bacillota bacterium]
MTPEEFDKRQNIKVSTDVLLYTVRNENQENLRKLPEKKLQLLMIKRKGEPHKGEWAIPGGAVESNEDVDAAAYRELKEETNIDNVYVEQLYTWGAKDCGLRSKCTRQNYAVSISYMALVDSEKLNIQAGNDAEEAKWFTVQCSTMATNLEDGKGSVLGKERDYYLTLVHQEGDKEIECSAIVRVKHIIEGRVVYTEREVLESSNIAFDHAKIIQYSLERLQNKVEYTNIAFNLMPEFFTIAEIQDVYQILLGKELLTPNFRKKIIDVDRLVVPTNKKRAEKVGHRPSILYKFNPDWFNKNL